MKSIVKIMVGVALMVAGTFVGNKGIEEYGKR